MVCADDKYNNNILYDVYDDNDDDVNFSFKSIYVILVTVV